MGPAQMLLSCVPCFLKHLIKVSVRGVVDGFVCALVFKPLPDACCVFIQASNVVDFVILAAIEVLGLCGHNYSPVKGFWFYPNSYQVFVCQYVFL